MANRPFRKLIWASVAFVLVATACSSDDASDSAESSPAPTSAPASDPAQEPDDATEFSPGVLDSGATIATFEQGPVTIHTYTNPEAGFGNTTTVIETENTLVLIDAHFGESSAREFRDLAESLGKPIDRLLITHDHPDHIGGIESVFSDLASYSTPGVIAGAAEAGTTITNEVSVTTEEIDGVQFVFDTYLDAEAAEQLVIRIPEAGVVAAGDLVYSDYHAVMTPTFDNWLDILDMIDATEDLELVIPGHGHPGDASVLTGAIDYLETARELYATSDDAETFNAAMIEAYPDFAGTNLLDFGSGRLFPKQ